MDYTEIQKKYCSNSRAAGTEDPGRMGKRLIKNIEEALPYFPKEYPVLDVGCGDGFGMSCWKANGYQVKGAELVAERVNTAILFGLDASVCDVENLSAVLGTARGYNIFCSHTLEHSRNLSLAIQELQKLALFTIWIIVPVEFKVQSSNPAHFSTIKNLGQIKKEFNLDAWVKIKEEYRFNLEYEGVIAFQRRM